MVSEEIVREMLLEFATVCTNTEEKMKIIVSYDENRVGEPYFKVFNSSSYTKATKIARISFLEPKYIVHNMNYGMENWILNSKEKQNLITMLTTEVDGISNWKFAILQYNLENNIQRDEQLKLSNEDIIKRNGLPLNTPIPDYSKLA